ncbi:MAG: cellulase family glycosylhydrolase [Spirochaetales bacterium]|nr:cellulase family glycosylhydrolase [Spirochaetales bacterium]
MSYSRISIFLLAALVFTAVIVLFSCLSGPKNIPKSFVAVKGNRFILDGKIYRYVGVNMWYAMNLGSSGEGGNRERLVRELDFLAERGITNLRIMASSEGPDGEPFRVEPALQIAPGVYNEDLFKGLDFALYEMGKRNMKAVLCLTNYWEWTGGMSQYLNWAGHGVIPYGKTSGISQIYTDDFYSNNAAVQLYFNHVSTVINRVNSFSGTVYRDDPAIMAWQLSNEPRGHKNAEAYLEWVRQSADHIKSLDPYHLVSTGSEGKTADPSDSNTLWQKIHAIDSIDYATVHVWLYNWGWYDVWSGEGSYFMARDLARKYMEAHIAMSAAFNKPLVLEEFGLPRDFHRYTPESKVGIRDEYYTDMFELGLKNIQEKGPLCGYNIWSWAGEGRANPEHANRWRKGDDFTGDPPQEPQGLNSVYDSDENTVQILSDYAARLAGMR